MSVVVFVSNRHNGTVPPPVTSATTTDVKNKNNILNK